MDWFALLVVEIPSSVSRQLWLLWILDQEGSDESGVKTLDDHNGRKRRLARGMQG